MKGFVPPDPETNVSQVSPALVYAPGKRKRRRYPAGCVTIKNSETEARESSSEEEHWFAATVLGPSKSSEGQFIYYLVDWL